MLEAVRKRVQRNRLGMGHRFVRTASIRHCTGQFHDLSQSTAIFFAFVFDRELHILVVRMRMLAFLGGYFAASQYRALSLVISLARLVLYRRGGRQTIGAAARHGNFRTLAE
jgi:hypothetical protein